MNCDNQQRHQPALHAVDNSSSGTCTSRAEGTRDDAPSESPHPCLSPIEYTKGTEILTQINSGQLLMVDSRRRSGLIIYKRFHAEFAGPGAAIGGFFDIDCQQIVPVGDLALVYPDAHEDRQKAYSTRRHWIRLTEQMTENSVPMQRAEMILTQFESYFNSETVAQIPDEALARLVGVLPHTIRLMRRTATNPCLSVRV